MAKSLFLKTLILTFFLTFSTLSPVLAYDNACIENIDDGVDNGAKDQKCLDLTSFLAQAWYDADQAGSQPSEYSEWNWDKPAVEIIKIYDDLKGLGSFFSLAEQKDYMLPHTRDHGWFEYGDYVYNTDSRYLSSPEILGILNSDLTNINWATVTAVTLLENPGEGYHFYTRGYVGQVFVDRLKGLHGYKNCFSDNVTENLNHMIATLKAFQGMHHGGGSFSALSGNGLNHQVFSHWNAYPIWQHRADAFYQKLLEFSGQYPEYSFIGQNLVNQSTSTCTERNYRTVNFNLDIEGTEELSDYDGFRLWIGHNSFSSYHPLDLSQSNYQVALPYFEGAITQENIYLDFISNKQPTFSRPADTFKDLGSDNYQASFTFNQNNMVYGNIHLNLNRFSQELGSFFIEDYFGDFRSPLYEIKEDQDYQIFLPEAVSVDDLALKIVIPNKDDSYTNTFPVEKIEKNPDDPDNLLNLEADLRLFHVQANLDLTFDQSYLDRYSLAKLELNCNDRWYWGNDFNKKRISSQTKASFHFYPSVKEIYLYGNLSSFNLVLLKFENWTRLKDFYPSFEINNDEMIFDIKKNFEASYLTGTYNFKTTEKLAKNISYLNLFLVDEKLNHVSVKSLIFQPRGKTESLWSYQLDFDKELLSPGQKVKLYSTIYYQNNAGKSGTYFIKEFSTEELEDGQVYDINFSLEKPLAYGSIDFLTNGSDFMDCLDSTTSLYYQRQESSPDSWSDPPYSLGFLQRDYLSVLDLDAYYSPFIYLNCNQYDDTHSFSLWPNGRDVLIPNSNNEINKNLTFDLRTSHLSGDITTFSNQGQDMSRLEICFVKTDGALDTTTSCLSFDAGTGPHNQEPYQFDLLPGRYRVYLKNKNDGKQVLWEDGEIIINDHSKLILQNFVFDLASRKVRGSLTLKDSILEEESYKKFKLLLVDDSKLVPLSQDTYTQLPSKDGVLVSPSYQFNDIKIGEYTPILIMVDDDQQATGEEVSLDKIVITQDDFLVEKNLIFGQDEVSDSCQSAGGSCQFPPLPLIIKRAGAYIPQFATLTSVNIGKKDCSLFKSCYLDSCSNADACATNSLCTTSGGYSLGQLNCGLSRVCCGDIDSLADPQIDQISYQDLVDGPAKYSRFSLTGENFINSDQVCIKELGHRCFDTETTNRDSSHLSILLRYDTLATTIRDGQLSSLTFTVSR